MKSILLSAWVLYAGVAAAAQSPPVLFATPMSPRNANYAIQVSLDAQRHFLKGTERIRWRNITDQPTSEAWFHLYLNAFANDQSVFIRESGSRLRGDQFDKSHWGYCQVLSLAETVDGAPVTLVQEFPGADRTVMRVALPAPVPPGGEAEFDVTFECQFPKVFARSGFAGTFNIAGQWFPKLGVFQGVRGWNCHEYHASSEFFSDFGVYDVSVTVPASYVVGATGVQWREARKGDTKTLDFHAEDVHDFAWVASPDLVRSEDSWQGVRIILLMQPGNQPSVQRHVACLKKALDCYARWIWKYPYPQITLVDPPQNGAGAGGMEYPMFFTTFGSPFFPKSVLFPEQTTVHEFGHNYWYGMEANNEFEEAWLDEGINSYYEARVMDEMFGPHNSFLNGFLGWHMGDMDLLRLEYLSVPDMDPMVLDSWKYSSLGAYEAMSYGKSAVVLKTLEGLLGRQKMDEVMRAFFMEVKFTHPTTEDFLRIVSNAAGQDLDPVLKPLLYGTGTVDFRVAFVRNVLRGGPQGLDLTKSPPAPFKAKADEAKAGAVRPKQEKRKLEGKGETARKGPEYDSKVVVERRGDLVLPVDVLVTFSDGRTKRERWDGGGRYVVFAYSGREVTRVLVDPDGAVPIDLQRLNNGWMAGQDHAPAGSLAGRTRVVFQGVMALLANVL